ncbi:MAG: metallophosphoesterase [Lachnospiraceae bacterium]|nr:metallophosphoesterase [Lachnospiraceae bacterium]
MSVVGFDINNYEIKNKPNVSNDIRFVLISDLHLTEKRKESLLNAENILEEITAINPDFVCIAGDLVDGNRECKTVPDYTYSFLERLAKVTSVFYGIGNHEDVVLKSEFEKIKSLGVIVLDNEKIRIDSLKVEIAGLTSGLRTMFSEEERENLRKKGKAKYSNVAHRLYCYFRMMLGSLLNKITGRIPKSMPKLEVLERWEEEKDNASYFKILISHHPEYYKLVKNYRCFDLMLSGHAHGGQIRIGKRGLYAPGQGLFPKLVKGLYYNSRLLVSAGAIFLLFINKPEIITVSLK